MRKLGLLLTIFIFSHSRTHAQSVADSSRIELKAKHAIVPATLALSGLITQGKISRHLQREVVSKYPDFHSKVDDYLLAAPTAFQLSLAASGVKGRHDLKEQIILLIASNIVSQGITQTLKLVSGYPRPDGSDYKSFPSGHTTIAFTNATTLHEEYGHRSIWYSVGGYTAATSVGAMRILNNRHWLADVLFGAGVGIGSTKATYLAYPWVKHKIKKNKGNQ